MLSGRPRGREQRAHQVRQGWSRRHLLRGAGGLTAGAAIGTRAGLGVQAAQAGITGDGTTVEPVDGPTQAVRTAAQQTGEWILPANRILTYYGFPTNPYMGILGEYGVNDDLDGLRQKLLEQAAEYEAVDPSRPIKIGFEVIASVAQADPGSDGSYLVYTDDELVQQYLDYTAEHDMLLFLDYQFGMHSVEDELDAARSWLESPHVHLALDPEFKMLPGEQPGVDLGSIDASDVKTAQSFLEQLTAEKGLPPKVLVVHQFYYTMITNKDQLAPADGMQLVIDMDGHGDPDLKRESYAVVITQAPIEFNGIKLFYPFDEPLMSAADVLALDPPPDMVIYQ